MAPIVKIIIYIYIYCNFVMELYLGETILPLTVNTTLLENDAMVTLFGCYLIIDDTSGGNNFKCFAMCYLARKKVQLLHHTLAYSPEFNDGVCKCGFGLYGQMCERQFVYFGIESG